MDTIFLFPVDLPDVLSDDTIAVVLVAAVVGSTVGGGLAVVATWTVGLAGPSDPTPRAPDGTDRPGAIERFDSEADFAAYLGRTRNGGTGTALRRTVAAEASVTVTLDTANQAVTDVPSRAEVEDTGADVRYSGTNVQDAGIAEPDLLKTDGTHATSTTPTPRAGSSATRRP